MGWRIADGGAVGPAVVAGGDGTGSADSRTGSGSPAGEGGKRTRPEARTREWEALPQWG